MALCCALSACDGSEHTHTFKSQWSYDEYSHWADADCGHDAKRDKAAHTLVDGVCTVCGYTAPTHQHTFDLTKWACDGESHWHPATCVHADEKGDAEAHTFVGDACTECGYDRTHVHTFDTETWDKDASTHWHPSICGHNVKDSEQAHSFVNGTCDVCGYVKGDTHTHAWVYGHNKTQHWQYCSDCGEALKGEAHSFGADHLCVCGFAENAPATGDMDATDYWIIGTFTEDKGGGVIGWGEVHLDQWQFSRLAAKDSEGFTQYVYEAELPAGAEFKIVNDAGRDYWDGSYGFEILRGGNAQGLFTGESGHGNIALSGSAGTFKLTLHTMAGDTSRNYLDIDLMDDAPDPEHEHAFSEFWTSDAEKHWHASTCGHNVREGEAEHVFRDDRCTICGYRVGGEDPASNYDTYYEIFVYSYNDSNGDSIGDLKGITQKLEYIHDMGYTGIWLTPIHPSPSANHKYSVSDYYGVDSHFGTLADLDELVETAHRLGIKVILDMVFNHSSNENKWFTEGLEAFRRGDTSNPYYSYYNFSNSERDGYRNYGGVWAEAWFDSSMPDLNLSNENVKDELSNVMRFWLVEHDVDGFRLDAAKHYFGPSGSPYHEQSAAFVGWITQTAKQHKPGAYIVSEVWEGEGTIRNYYNWSGSDSFFYFPTSTGGSGDIANAVNGHSPDTFYNSMTTAISVAGGHIPAPFLDNHDVDRIADKLGRNEDKIKFAYGLLSMYTGTTFTYYGDELGMIGTRTASNTDAERRYAMLWDSNARPSIRVDGYANSYYFEGYAQQVRDTASILNYYKACNALRNQFAEIVCGTPSKISSNDQVLVFSKQFNGSTVTVAINFSESEKRVTVPGGSVLAGSACVTGSVTASGSTLTMPKYSIAVLS